MAADVPAVARPQHRVRNPAESVCRPGGPGESLWIEYAYTVRDDKWGNWFQRAERLPTERHVIISLFSLFAEGAQGGAHAVLVSAGPGITGGRRWGIWRSRCRAAGGSPIRRDTRARARQDRSDPARPR
ncbi:hypothetical protein E0L36_20620 [Streptomyces sp. AJS327]|nr:hypothetical protein [Streptomyces sp. AJS327]